MIKGVLQEAFYSAADTRRQEV